MGGPLIIDKQSSFSSVTLFVQAVIFLMSGQSLPIPTSDTPKSDIMSDMMSLEKSKWLPVALPDEVAEELEPDSQQLFLVLYPLPPLVAIPELSTDVARAIPPLTNLAWGMSA